MRIVLLRDSTGSTLYNIGINRILLGYVRYNDKSKKKELYDENDELISYSRNTIDYERQFKKEFCTVVSLKENKTVRVFLNSFFWQTYTMILDQEKLVNVISHRGNMYSFFIDNKQVGSYNTCDKYNHNKLVIELTDDLDPLPFIHTCLELYSDFGNEGLITKSPYNLWFQKVKFNKDWKP